LLRSPPHPCSGKLVSDVRRRFTLLPTSVHSNLSVRDVDLVAVLSSKGGHDHFEGFGVEVQTGQAGYQLVSAGQRPGLVAGRVGIVTHGGPLSVAEDLRIGSLRHHRNLLSSPIRDRQEAKGS